MIRRPVRAELDTKDSPVRAFSMNGSPSGYATYNAATPRPADP